MFLCYSWHHVLDTGLFMVSRRHVQRNWDPRRSSPFGHRVTQQCFFFLVLAAAYLRLQLSSLRLPPFARITFLPRLVWRPFVPVHVLLWSWYSIHRVAPGSLLVSLHYVCRLHTKQKKEHVVAGEIGIEGAIFHVFPITTRLPF
jgi:hypothetical protein